MLPCTSGGPRTSVVRSFRWRRWPICFASSAGRDRIFSAEQRVQATSHLTHGLIEGLRAARATEREVLAALEPRDRDAPAAERRKAKKAAKPEKGPPRWKRALDNGSPRTTFAVGALLTLPGASYLAALGQIVEGGYGTTQSVLMVVLANVIMLMLLEVPLLGYMLKPDWTPGAVERAKAWVIRHARRAAVIGTGTLGGLLVLRGVITLIAS